MARKNILAPHPASAEVIAFPRPKHATKPPGDFTAIFAKLSRQWVAERETREAARAACQVIPFPDRA